MTDKLTDVLGDIATTQLERKREYPHIIEAEFLPKLAQGPSARRSIVLKIQGHLAMGLAISDGPTLRFYLDDEEANDLAVTLLSALQEYDEYNR